MKRILFILPSLAVGGLEKEQITIANGLVRKGYSVTVKTLEKNDEMRRFLDDRVIYDYKPYKPHPIMKRIPYIRNKFYDDGMWETRAAPQTLYDYYVGNEKYDVEIAFFRGLPVKIISGSKNKNAVKIAWVHSDFKKCGGITANFNGLSEVREAYGKFDKIVCVSEEARTSFNETIGFPEKTITVYNMLCLDEIKAKALEKCPIQKERFIFLSVGRLVPAKGYDRLIAAYKNAGVDADLWIIGEGGEKERLIKEAEDFGLSGVKFLGKKLNPYKYMSAADAYVCSSRFEGFNLTIAEALAVGLPVISTACTGPYEILEGGKYGLIVKNDTEGLTDGLKKLCSDNALLKEYKAKAEKRSEFFDESAIIDKITALF